MASPKLSKWADNAYSQVNTAVLADKSTWMWVFGPDLHFDASGKHLREDERTHFW